MSDHDQRHSRASFLAGAACCAATALALPSRLRAAPSSAWRERVLWLVREGTGEEASVPFCRDGHHVYGPGYHALCWVLRDHQIDPSAGYVSFSIDTIEALWEVQQMLLSKGIGGPIVITSGYRSPETNARTEGAVWNSQHVYATAVDMYVDAASMRVLYDACYSRAISGGIGYYENHVHLDTGPRRYWTGYAPPDRRFRIDPSLAARFVGRRSPLA